MNRRLWGCGIAAGLAFVAHTRQEADNPILRYMSGFTMVGATAAGLAIAGRGTKPVLKPQTVDGDSYLIRSKSQARKVTKSLRRRGYQVSDVYRVNSATPHSEIGDTDLWIDTDAPAELVSELLAAKGKP